MDTTDVHIPGIAGPENVDNYSLLLWCLEMCCLRAEVDLKFVVN